MKPILFFGLVLVVLGALALFYHGITYTSRERLIEIGPIQASTNTKKTIPLPPLLGGLMLGSGIVLVIIGRKKS
jgi:hypothetical protein